MLTPALLDALRTASGEALSESSLLPLEESDRLFEAYSRAFQECTAGERPHLYLRAPRDAAHHAFSRIRRIGASLPDAAVVMFGRDWEDTGAAQLPAASFFMAGEALLRLNVDDLRAASPDGTQGLLVDHLEHENEIELWCWGDAWVESAGKDDPPVATGPRDPAGS
jgi:hypothetical protein